MLAPIILTPDEIDQLGQNQTTPTPSPSKTYTFDFNNNEIVEVFIDGIDAIEQAAIKAIYTMRDRYLIYSSDYGSEIFDLLGPGYSEEYLKLEVPRLISEALIPDDRIVQSTNFVISKIGDTLNVQFDLVTTLSNDNLTVKVVL